MWWHERVLLEDVPDRTGGRPGREDAGRPRGARPVPALLRAVRPAHPRLDPDPAQERVLATRPGSGPLVLLGAPGTGRTTTLRELVARRVERDGLDPDRALVLAPSRVEAGRLRDELSARLRRTAGQPAARTPQSWAFGLLRLVHAREGAPPPRLMSGAEQDAVLADLLAGHLAATAPEDERAPDAEDVPVPPWPADVPRSAWGLRSFRNELRDLTMRAVERGTTPAELADLGRRTGRGEWVAAASVLAEYQGVNALGRAEAYDPAGVVDEAVARLLADPELLAAERGRWDLVAVDDAHELSEAGLRLLEVVAGGGRDLLLTADPDSVTQGFRGADARAAAELPSRFPLAGSAPAPVVVLGTGHRQAPALRAVTARAAARVGALGGAPQRAAVPAERTRAAGEGRVDVAVLPSVTAEAAWTAQRLRRRHLLDGVPWHEMAVLVRSAGSTSALRRALQAAGVPLAVPLAEVPVRDEPAVRPLLLALEVVLRPARLDPDTARDLVTSPLGGADVVALRRLRQVLRRAELAAGGGRGSDAVLAAVLADPARAERSDAAFLAAAEGTAEEAPLRPALRVAAVLDAGRAAAAEHGASAETVLWALWAASGLGERWQRSALAGGVDGARADRDLDAVLALFEAAGRFVDRFPGAGSAERFLDDQLRAEVPSDTLAERAPDTGAVTLTTPQGAVGREWDVVVVCGVQEGVWPDLRLRGSVLGAQDLVDVLQGRDTGPAGARRAVLDDELRLFHVAVSRARRELTVTAVRDEDERPSAFLDLVDPPDARAPRAADDERPLAAVPRALTLPALVARLRQVLCAPPGAEPQERRAAAARHLARLAAAGVPGADPDDWYGVGGVSDEAPVREPGAEVPVSPSRVEAFERCGLRWLLDAAGARRADSTGQSLGTLVHRVAAELPDADAAALRARLAALWPTLGLPAGWVADTERRRAERMLDKLAAYHRSSRDAGRELVGVEQDVDVRLGRARVRGRVDRLERDADGRLVVVDLKTGRGQPPAAEIPRNPQLGVYQVAVSAGGAEAGGAALVQLGGTQRTAPEQRQPALAEDPEPSWAVDLLQRAADGMAGARFEAVVGPHCASCPVRSSCPAQDPGRSVCEEVAR
ncbi:ATP-dependent helicase [Kineococcus terrestris]|uniref:ATP-dependent helicase n=1 Tax=Kineococcus terrestris TaxID=2044856 RepID=UPI0034DB6EA6